MLDLAGVTAGQRLLEIGSGWGALAVVAAQRYGVQVTSVTLSAEQLEATRERAQAAGVADRISFELRDYRDVHGEFDAIVSVEMIEAVGHEYLGSFFAACDRLLAPGGRVVLQAITVPDQIYEDYRRSWDWLRKRISPGGHAPSLGALCEAMSRDSRFAVQSIRNIGPHYALTLKHWREHYESQCEELAEIGYDSRFQRTWSYYLSYCEAGFAARSFCDLQMVLARNNDVAAVALPHRSAET